jgi:hypothetical protein
MASDETHWRRHRALASVYHHGRAGALAGITPRHVLPLENAVDELLRSEDDEEDHDVRRSVRLALADLCRTRAGRRDDRAEEQIHRLAAWLEGDGQHAMESGKRFTAMFAENTREGGPHPDDAFVMALRMMVTMESERRAKLGKTREQKSWKPADLEHYRVYPTALERPPGAESEPDKGTEPPRRKRGRA